MPAAAVPASAARGLGTTRTTKTHCPYCSLQCGMAVTAGERPATLVPRRLPDQPRRAVLQGLVRRPSCSTTPSGCSARWSARRPATGPARWSSPPGTTPSTGSPTAIRRTQQQHGRDAVGCFGGGGLTNEKAYQFGKFARVALRTSAIDYNGRFCMSSAAGAANRAFGLDRGMPFPLSDIAAADVVVLVGSNPADTMPPAMQYFDAGRGRGAQHVVVDPRRTATARNAALHLQAAARAPTSRSPTACCTSRSPRAWSTRRTSPTGRRASTR